MCRVARICVIAVLVVSPVSADDTDTQSSQEIVIADELRTAFYEHAPRSLATTMSKAVVSWCSSYRNESEADLVSWLCRGDKLVYFRSVYVNGAKGRHGLVCENNGTSTLKYFGMDLVADVVADGSCVQAEFDGSVYELYVERFGGVTPNKQLQRTVTRHRGDAASAPFRYALAARFIRRRAAAELRR